MPHPDGTLAVGCDWLPVTLDWTDNRVVAIRLADRTTETGTPPPWLRDLAAAIRAYWAGDLGPLPLDRLDFTRFTDFQARVYRACHAIPAGETRGYGALAAAAGSPRAARAVGRCMATNPYPLLVPCHRVVAADGTLGGFGCGLPLKRRLLAHEGAAGQLSFG